MKRVAVRAVVALLAVSVFAVSALLAGALRPGVDVADTAATPVGGAPAAGAGPGSARDLRSLTLGLQARLERVPTDWRSWAALGQAYVQQARVTADPTWLPKADEALDRSEALQVTDNLDALVARAGLAAGLHEFAESARLAAEAERLAPFNAAAKAVLGDALVEVGRYDEAFAAYQRLNDLRPGLTAYVRAAYAAELQGNLPGARTALTAALGPATDRNDIAFVQFRLGEVAWAEGDDATAARHYEIGRQADPVAPDPIAGAAKVAAAGGDTDEALRLYADLVELVPQPAYVAAYGDLLLSLGREADAEEQYELVDLQRDVAAANGVLVDLETALALADRGKGAEAVTAARAEYAVRRTITTSDALAWSLYRAGRAAEALPYAREAVRLGTRDPLLRFHAGAVAAAAGDHAAARRDLTMALTQPAFSPRWAPEARRLLAALPRS